MKIYLENLKILTLAQILRYAVLLMNAVSFVFVLVYSIVHTGTAAADGFAIFFIVTLVLDLLYATVTKNGFGFWFILGCGIGMLGIYGFSLLSGMSIVVNSVNIGGVVLALLMLLGGSALLVADCLGLPPVEKKGRKAAKIFRIVLTVVASAALIAFAILTYNAIYNYGYSDLNYTTGRAEALIAFSAFAFLCLLIRVTLTEGSGNLKSKLMKGWAFLLIVLGLSAFTLSNYFTEIGSVESDIAAADQAFSKAFGEGACEGTKDMRRTQYSFADSLFGTPTKGFQIEKDVVFYTEPEGLTLRFDAYVPVAADAHKSVIVAIHGRGNDKGDLSVPHRNKYFASKGYVVYDLQVGDFNERGTGADPSYRPRSADMLPNIDKFFRFETARNAYGADFGSVFLTGYSMGGSLAAKYGLSYPNVTEELGASIKGIIPCYPSYSERDEGIDDYIGAIEKESVPMLMLMGKNDGIVNNFAIEAAKQAYVAAENPNYAGISISYAGHGCDISMTSRANQIFLYYMERFLYRFR